MNMLPFLITPQDLDEVVRPAVRLLDKIVNSSRLTDRATEPVLLLVDVLHDLPNPCPWMNAAVTVTGPRRWYGDHEIYHFWTIRIEGNSLEISGGGHFYRQSTGGDSFTSFRWAASPGEEAWCDDYFSTLDIVDDAATFAEHEKRIDLSDAGYKIDVEVDGESVE